MPINLKSPLQIFFIAIPLCLIFYSNASAQIFQNYIHPTTPLKVELNGSELWVASVHGGLIKHDLQTNESIFYNRANSGLPNNNVFNVAVDSLDNKWILTKDHIVKMKDDIWTVFDTLNYDLVGGFREIEIASNNDVYIFSQQPALFLKFNGQTWQEIPVPTSFSFLAAMTKDKNDAIWFIHEGEDLVKFQNNVWELIDGPPPPWSFYSNQLQDLAIDTFGNKWISSFEYGILKYDDMNWEWIDTTTSNLPDNSCRKIYADQDNQIWVNSGGKHISKFNGTTFDNISFPYLTHSMNSNMVKDEEGQLWFGNSKGDAEDHSLQKLVDTVYTGYDISNTGLLRNGARDFLFEDEENVWIAGEGLVHFDGTTWKNHLTDTIFPNVYINAMTKDSSGHLWLVGQKIYEFDPSQGVINEWMPPSFVYMYDIAIDQDNVKWIASSKGVIKLDGNDIEMFNFTNSNYPGFFTNEVEINSSNNLMVGSANGLYEYDGTDWITHLDISVTAFHMTENQTVWLASSQGLGKYDGTDLIVFDTSNSEIPHNFIHDITIEDDSIIWVTTSLNQVVRFDGVNVHAYNHDNSPLSSSDFFSKIEVDPLGRKWITANGSGVTVIEDSDVNYNPTSIKSIVKNTSISIYPNPTKDQLNVAFDFAPKGKLFFSFFDLTGKEVKSYHRTVDQVSEHSLHDLPTGIYILEIRNGDFNSIHKIVKL